MTEPDKLCDELAVKVIWQNFLHRRRLVMPMICVTALNGAHVKKVSLLVEGYGKAFTYQSVATAYNIRDKRVYVALPSLPFRRLKYRMDSVETPYTRIKVSVLEMTLERDTSIDCSRLSQLHITPFDSLDYKWGDEAEFVERWGDVFNLGFIRSLIVREQMKLIGSRYTGRFHWLREKIFSNLFAVKIVFWSKNLVFGRQVERELAKYLSTVMPKESEQMI